MRLKLKIWMTDDSTLTCVYSEDQFDRLNDYLKGIKKAIDNQECFEMFGEYGQGVTLLNGRHIQWA